MKDDELRNAYLLTRIWFITNVPPYFVESVPVGLPGASDFTFPGAMDMTMAQAFGDGVSEVWCIAADNAKNAERTETENNARNQELLDLLMERKLFPTYGFPELPDGSHPDETFLVGLKPAADIEDNRQFIRSLAMRFEQDAALRFVDDVQQLIPVLNERCVGEVNYRMMHSSFMRSYPGEFLSEPD